MTDSRFSFFALQKTRLTLSALSTLSVLSLFLSFSAAAQTQPSPDVPELLEEEFVEETAFDEELTPAPLPSPVASPVKTAPVNPVALGGSNISAFTRDILGKTSVGGYFDTDFNFPVGGNSFFNQHRLILQVSSYLHERLFFNTEIEYEYGAVLGNGTTNDGQLKVEQIFLDYKIEDYLIFRAGSLLIPMGRLNILHDSDFRDTVDRPLFNRFILPTTWTETGAGFYGLIPLSEDWEMNYEAYVVQGLRDELSDGLGLARARNSLSVDNNNNKGFTSRVGFSPAIGTEFGLGGYYAALDAENKKNLGMVVADFNTTWGPFELLGEGGVTFFDPTTQNAASPTTALLPSNSNVVSDTLTPLLGPMWGYYIEGHYHFFPAFLENTFLSNGFEQPVLTAFARISQIDTDASTLNQNDRSRFTIGINYRPITNTVFKLEYQWNIENEAFIRNDPSLERANNQFVASVATGF